MVFEMRGHIFSQMIIFKAPSRHLFNGVLQNAVVNVPCNFDKKL